jgi:uncharacterized protein (TIGR02996 family)
MDTRATLLQALHDNPADEVTWLALADWLEEAGEPDRAELIRLHRSLPALRSGKKRTGAEERIRTLLASGVRPCVPELTNSIGMRLVLIPAGKFRMGSPVREPRRMDDETLHTVRITKPFYLGVYPVTQAEWLQVMRDNPSQFTKDEVEEGLDTNRFPVEQVLYSRAGAFCQRLSKRKDEKQAGRVYRLPTEAEWEYACRAWGSSTFPFHFGRTLDASQANFRTTYPFPPPEDVDENGEWLERPCEVGQYAPNAFGLYDMHGNVDEWVSDVYEPEYYSDSTEVDPTGPATGDRHVVRGGSWGGQGEDCRTAVRIGYDDDYESDRVGLRVAMTIEQK